MLEIFSQHEYFRLTLRCPKQTLITRSKRKKNQNSPKVSLTGPEGAVQWEKNGVQKSRETVPLNFKAALFRSLFLQLSYTLISFLPVQLPYPLIRLHCKAVVSTRPLSRYSCNYSNTSTHPLTLYIRRIHSNIYTIQMSFAILLFYMHYTILCQYPLVLQYWVNILSVGYFVSCLQ